MRPMHNRHSLLAGLKEGRGILNALIYYQNTTLVSLVLISLMLLGTEMGFRFGKRRYPEATDAVRSQVGVVLAAMLGLLSLLLSFTFSWALQRYEDRSEALVAEANAIGTTSLRIQLLPVEMHEKIQSLLSRYTEARIRENELPLANPAERHAQVEQAHQLATQLWGEAMRAVQKDPRPVTSGLFVQSLNQLIDAASVTHAAFQRRVPEVILVAILVLSVIVAALLGYASGLAGHRVSAPTFLLVGGIVVAVFLIMDLDRPRSGLIQVNRETLQSLQVSILIEGEGVGLEGKGVGLEGEGVGLEKGAVRSTVGLEEPMIQPSLREKDLSFRAEGEKS
jgi:hypothetical protein